MAEQPAESVANFWAHHRLVGSGVFSRLDRRSRALEAEPTKVAARSLWIARPLGTWAFLCSASVQNRDPERLKGPLSRSRIGPPSAMDGASERAEVPNKQTPMQSPMSSSPLASSSRLFQALPDQIDLRDVDLLERVLETADSLMERSVSIEALREFEWIVASQPDDWPGAAHLAIKLALSKALLTRRKERLDLAVVTAVYGEHERIQSAAYHPMGEAWLERKIRQLEWLTNQIPSSHYEIYIVDDGCPHGSGRIVQEKLVSEHPQVPAHVLFLDDAIKDHHPMTRGMTSSAHSQKGGAILLGLYEAAQNGDAQRKILYTDADLSTHLGQSGLLIEALDRPEVDLAIGSRRSKTSFVVKSGERNERGRIFIYLWKQLLKKIDYVPDTQCGFKAFRSSVVRDIISQAQTHNFAFDLELLLLTELRRTRSVFVQPIAWIDSDQASNTSESGPYLGMLQSVVNLYRRYEGPTKRSDAFANAIDQLTLEGWEAAVLALSEKLSDADQRGSGDVFSIGASEIQAFAN